MRLTTIAESLEQSLRSAVWLHSADASAVSAVRRLAVLLDALFDAGDSKDLAQLLARYAQLLSALRLTPESRQEETKANDQPTKSLESIQGTYARLIAPEGGVAKAKRSNARSGSK